MCVCVRACLYVRARMCAYMCDISLSILPQSPLSSPVTRMRKRGRLSSSATSFSACTSVSSTAALPQPLRSSLQRYSTPSCPLSFNRYAQHAHIHIQYTSKRTQVKIASSLRQLWHQLWEYPGRKSLLRTLFPLFSSVQNRRVQKNLKNLCAAF